MRTLALETSGAAGSVALFDGDALVASQPLDPSRRSAQTLAPTIRAVLCEAGWQPKDLGCLAVAAGPGSFTGLRIGVTTAKVLAYAVGAEVVAVDTLEAIALQAPSHPAGLWVAMDAHRGQVFATRFVRAADGSLAADRATAILDAPAWLALLQPGELVTGPMLEKAAGGLPPGVAATPPSTWSLTAESVGRLALARYHAGQRDDPWRLAPRYFRTSAAEEKLASRLAT
jgi:tRNA threonylcarbamoyladenosine biosynthesis protein TsaB